MNVQFMGVRRSRSNKVWGQRGVIRRLVLVHIPVMMLSTHLERKKDSNISIRITTQINHDPNHTQLTLSSDSSEELPTVYRTIL